MGLGMAKRTTMVAVALGALAVQPPPAVARNGQEVFEAVCAACHATGANGAPRIGDERAWTPRAAQGLTSLTRHAIEGIRKMPPHGGNRGVTDFEIELAITYMVNHSGGHWAVPIDKAAPPRLRSGEQVVRAQCVKCHGAGVGGAPRIGDRAAWIQRLEHGLGPLVRSAIGGHGGMPPRGGMPNLTDPEIRDAILWMIDRSVAANASPRGGAAPGEPRGNHRVVDGIDVYLGIVSAGALRREHSKAVDAESTMHGGIPAGKGYYHVNVSLFDSRTGAPIGDARVSAKIWDPVMGGVTEPLEPMVLNDTVSYGNYFRIDGPYPHRMMVTIVRAGSARAATAEFDLDAAAAR